jgi:histidine ammonia-lyase
MPFFSADQPLTLPELAEALRSHTALRLPPAADAQPPASPPLSQPASPAEQASTDWLLAHTCGVGLEVPAAVVRRMLLLLAQRLSSASNGAQLAAARRLLDFYNRDVWPVVYEQGAGGATDAVPLAHLCLPLLGLGEVNYQGYRLAAADVLGLFGWEALALPAAAGSALLAGQEFTLAYATEALERTEHLLSAATALGELTAAASAATAPESTPNAHSYHPLAPGASRAAVAYVSQAVQAACNTSFTPDSTSAQAGSQPSSALPLVLDHLAPAVAALGSRSVQRTAQLLAGQPGLPPALATPDLPLGLQATCRTAASLASQNHLLCVPTAVASSWDDLRDGQAANAAIRARQVVENTEQILGIELLVAAQALDLRAAASPDPARTGPAPAAILAAFREHVTFVARARVLAPDLHRAARFVREYHWT